MAHLESSVLHADPVPSVLTDTVSSDWGLSMLGSAAQRHTDDSSTKSSEDNRLGDARCVKGEGVEGKRKVFLL